MKKFLLSTLAISLILLLSEGIRNGYLLRTHWVEHFDAMGLVYPEDSINNLMWGVWIVGLALIMTYLSGKLSVMANAIIVWSIAYELTFVAMWNYEVLPLSVLPIAVPWSFLVILLMAKVADQIYGRHVT